MSSRNTHKYEMVKTYLYSYIQKHALGKGDRIPSENELAEQFSVSRLTARQAISELVNEHVLYRQRGSGTFFNGPMRRVGVLMSYIDSYIFTDIVQGIDQVLQEKNVGMILSSSGNSITREKACLENLVSQGIDGLIYEPAKSAINTANVKLLQSIVKRGVKIVCINGYLPDIKAGRILTDDRKGIGILVDKMAQLGHISIAGIFVSDLIQGIRRYEGFCEAMKKNCRTVEKDQILWIHISDSDQNIHKMLNAFIDQVLAKRQTAICCYNDIIAQKAIEILVQKGIRVPEDISVTGFDGSALARLTAMYYLGNTNEDRSDPIGGLATVTHPCSKLGMQSVNTLFQLIDGTITEEEAVIEMIPEFQNGLSLGKAKKEE